MRIALALFNVAVASLWATEPAFNLPATVRPVKYRLDLHIDPAKTAFEGTVEIEIDVSEPTTTIWLNGHGLDVRSASLDGTRVEAGVVRDEFIALHAPSPVESGRHAVRLAYAGNFSDESYGVYRRQIGSGSYVFKTC